ncbi:MAG: DUF4199 domain-containing protein [Bacteroidetes bacterium]|nr:DUF4199 domain-containing protein [Bacteroidota bacterium]
MRRFFNHPAARGALTGIIMITTGVTLRETNSGNEIWAKYLLFIEYGFGIIWSIWMARKDSSRSGSFGNLFQQGFRHFAVTALLMVGFTLFILWRHPEFAREEAAYQRTLLTETKKYTPNQIEELVTEAEKQFPVRFISATVFGYLLLGAVFAAAGSALLTRKNPPYGP